MKTLQQFSGQHEAIPASTSWHIADLAEACGRQALYIRHSSSRLLAMEEHVLMESAVSSNRIEDRGSDPRCTGTMLFGKRQLHNSDECVRNYRQALEWISRQGAELSVSLDTLLQLHALTCGEKAETGIPAGIEDLIALWSNSLEERWVHPLLLLTAFNLDFLCLHPFDDGNGRVARLLLRLQSCRLGYDVGRYVSLERLIEQNRSQYREALKESSRGWQDGSHNPWPYIDYLLFILKTAYRELESRLNVSRNCARRENRTNRVSRAGVFRSLFLGRTEKKLSGDEP